MSKNTDQSIRSASFWQSVNRVVFKTNRHRTMVDWPKQLRYASEVTGLCVLFFLYFVLVLYLDPFATSFSGMSIEDHQGAMEYLFAINAGKWPFFFFGVLLFFYLGLFQSHYMIGPYYRIRRSMVEYLDGQIEKPFRLRRHDYFNDIVPVFEAFYKRVHAQEGILQETKDLMESLKGASLDEETKSKVMDLHARISEQTLNSKGL